MKVAMGCDHGGYNLKVAIKKHLEKNGIECLDLGTDSATESVNYAHFAKKVADTVAKGDADFGILCCGTGIGIGIAANKVKGIRAATVSDTFSARMTKMHNNANIICLGERTTGVGLALDIVDAYMSAEFEGGRHQERIDAISEIEAER